MRLGHLVEGIYWDQKAGSFVIDLEVDSKYRDAIYTGKSRSRSSVFAAFNANRRVSPEIAKAAKLSLKHLNLIGDWETMIDQAVERFRKAHDLTQYDLVVTPHTPRDAAVLANNLLTSLEPFLKPGVRILRGGVRKSPHDAISFNESKVRADAPPNYTPEQVDDLVAKVRSNFNSAQSRAKREGRSFKMTDIIVQFRKFITGLMVTDEQVEPGTKVLFVDDVFTSGATLQSVKDALNVDHIDCFVGVVG